MFIKLQKSVCLLMLMCLLAVSTVDADEEEQLPESEVAVEAKAPLVIEIVGGHYDYCQIETLRKRVNRNYEESLGSLLKPNAFSSDVRCEGKACLGYFHAGKSSLKVKNVDLAQRKITIWAGKAACRKVEECGELIKNYSDIILIDEPTDKADLKIREFAIERSISFDEMYDAEFKNLSVGCAPGKCKATIYESEGGPIFYLEFQKPGGKIEKKLIVNLDMESTLSESDVEIGLKRCETSVSDEVPALKPRVKGRR